MTELKTSHLSEIYNNRFTKQTRDARLRLWAILCQNWIQAYIPKESTVLDLAAGQCEFINQIQARRKIAVDLNQDIYQFAAPDVQVIIAMSHDMQEIAEASVDVVFVSNFFEHLPTKQVLMDTLREIQRVLNPGGRILILQPNIRFLHGEYWDFIDHYLPLTDRSLVEALELINMHVEEVRPRFLPYTTRSRIPQWSFLVKLYLMLPLAQWLLGKQAWIVATKQ